MAAQVSAAKNKAVREQSARVWADLMEAQADEKRAADENRRLKAQARPSAAVGGTRAVIIANHPE